MTINEFFQFPIGKRPESVSNSYKEHCKRDFNNLYTDEDWNKLFQILEKDCGGFLDEIKNDQSIIFRGIKGTKLGIDKGIWKKTSRNDRYAVDMRPDVSQEFDNLFSEKFGIPIRRMGVFTTKQPLNAVQYTRYVGDDRRRAVNFLFFPIGEYQYFWNPKIMDLYSDVELLDWYNDYDYIGDDHTEDDYVIDRWWSIYGAPGQKRDRWSWSSGGGRGQYSYKGIETGLNEIPRILGEIRENPDIYSVTSYIEQEDLIPDLVWIPEVEIDDFEKNMVDEIKRDSMNSMNQIVQGYQDYGMKEVDEQEITFICKEYYLIDDAFLHKLIEWIESK